MQPQKPSPVLMFVSILMLASLACSTSVAAEPTSTSKPSATSTITATPSKTPKPTTTPRPTRTPNLAATEQMDALNAEAQSYFELGYLETTNGKFTEFDDSTEEWAQLDWYKPSVLLTQARDFT